MKKIIKTLFACCIFVEAFGLKYEIKLLDPDEPISDIQTFDPSNNPTLPAQSALLLTVWPYLTVSNQIPNQISYNIPKPLQPNEIDTSTEPNRYHFAISFISSEEESTANVMKKIQRILDKIEALLEQSKENFTPIEDLFRQCNYDAGNSTGRKWEYNLQKRAEYENRINDLKRKLEKWICKHISFSDIAVQIVAMQKIG